MVVVRNLKSMLKRVFGIGRPTYQQSRSIALQLEIQFWREWFLTGGLEWPHDYHPRFNPDQPIQNHIAKYIDRLRTDCIHLLDVGSGPLTKVGMKHPTKELVITATDLLAAHYDFLLAELNITPLVRTIYADAEKLVAQFGENAFDIVHGQNSIDHMTRPIRAIQQMLAVCKPQGYVVLYHEENEGENQCYKQLHQWNFTCENDCFVIHDRRGKGINVTKKLAPVCDVECVRDEDGKILSSFRKRAK